MPKIKVLENISDWDIPTSETKRGDRIQQINSQQLPIEDWSFDGYLWRSSPKQTQFNFINITDTTKIILPVDSSQNLLIDKLTFNYYVDGKNELNKFWRFNLYKVSDSLAFSLLATEDSLSNYYDNKELQINQQDLIDFSHTIYYLFQPETVGKTGTLSVSGKLTYQIIQGN